MTGAIAMTLSGTHACALGGEKRVLSWKNAGSKIVHWTFTSTAEELGGKEKLGQK